jgi:outer membrane protein assembly factor BamA
LPPVKTYQLLTIALGALLLASISGCKVTKNFTEGQSLLTGMKVRVVNDQNIAQRRRSTEDLKHVAAQQPNKKLFRVMPVKLWLYTAANRKKETKVKWWIKNKVGEAPVIYDPELADKSDNLMIAYLQNYGYLYAQVTHEIKTKNKKTTITYTVKKGPVWHLGDITFPSAPYLTDSITRKHISQSKLHTGDNLDITTLKAERDRMELDLKNAGFFFFSKDYVAFDLDTTKKHLTANINIRINQPSDSVQHQQYKINEIYVTSDFGAELTEGPVKRDTIRIGEYHFMTHKKTVIPKVILDAVFIRQGQLYSKDNYTKTVKTLSNLTAFKFVTVDYNRAAGPDNTLNCVINLTPGKKQSFNIEAQANVSQEGYFGVSGLISYKDKNLTHRSDLLSIDFTPSVQFLFGKNKPVSLFTEDYAPSISYYFNKFLFPMSKKLTESVRDKSPRTHLSIKYNYEHRYDYDTSGNVKLFYKLHGFNASFGYEWNKNAFMRHILNPINFTIFLLPEEGPYFINLLNSNPTLKSSYEPQIIFGPSYTFTYSNQKTKTDRKYMFFRTSLETAGNILMAGFALANLDRSATLPYEILKKEFSQYVRGEFDLRGYYKLGPHSLFAGRSFFGIAIPYGNSTAVPFTKQFSVGGPNSLRGFEIREVGPGAYVNPDHDANANLGFFNQTGDMKMEANLELRFDIFKWFKGALFTDMGNVWLIKKDPATPLGEFEFNTFWKQFAVDVGPGIRLDFNYFVVRLDYGIPIRNPAITGNDKWYIHETNVGPGVFQLAVGYPF